MNQTRSADHPTRLGHRPVIPPVVNPSPEPLPEALLERFREAYLPDLSDAVGNLYTMSPAIRPVYSPSPRLLGQALTVKAPPGDNLFVHGALTMVQPGDVLVIDWRGYVEGCASGASSLAVPMTRGLRGAVVDGAWRDVGELRAMGLPLFARSLSAFSPPKDRPGEINVPVACGGVVVAPGDLIVGDEEGVVVVPRAWIDRVSDSLKPYRRPASVQDFDLAQLQRGLVDKEDYFRRVIADYGGTD